MDALSTSGPTFLPTAQPTTPRPTPKPTPAPSVTPGNPTAVPVPAPTPAPTLAPSPLPSQRPSAAPTPAPTIESCDKVRLRTGPPPNVYSARFASTGANILVDLDATSDQAGMLAGEYFQCAEILDFAVPVSRAKKPSLAGAGAAGASASSSS